MELRREINERFSLTHPLTSLSLSVTESGAMNRVLLTLLVLASSNVGIDVAYSARV